MKFIGLDDLILESATKKECDRENFLNKDIMMKVHKDNKQMSSFVNLINRIAIQSPTKQPKIWKPSKFRISKSVA